MPPPPPSRLTGVQRMLSMIWLSIRLHWQTTLETLRRDGAAALMNIQQIRDAAQSKVFNLTSSAFIAYEDTTIVPTLVRSASGMVLELGPGSGNQLHRFDHAEINYIYGIEPNVGFRAALEAKVTACELEGKYKLITAGIEDSDILAEAGVEQGSLDTVLCIQVLCAVKDPGAVMKEVYRLLKPGGKFIYWEHGRSRNTLTSMMQSILNPSWSSFMGCQLTRNILHDILDSGEWEHPKALQVHDDGVSLLPRSYGILIKRAVPK